MKHLRATLSVLGVAWLLAAAPAALQAEEPAQIKHRFMAYDEGRALLHYVDQRDPAKDWKLPLPRAIRDFQLAGGGKFIVAQGFGYSVYELETRKLVEDVKPQGVSGVMSARRRADGFTVLGANVGNGIQIVELDKENKVTRKATFPGLKTLRMIRLTSDGHVLLSEEKGLTEVAFDAQDPSGGKVVKSIPLPHGRNAFLSLKKEDGSYLVGGGFAKAVFDFAPDGTLRKEFNLKAAPATAGPLFFAGLQVLKNGNIVVCNWTGHGPQDGAKGWQLVEFAPDGAIVWHWHNPEQAGTLVNIAVLDDLDGKEFLDDSSGVLK